MKTATPCSNGERNFFVLRYLIRFFFALLFDAAELLFSVKSSCSSVNLIRG